MTTRAKSQLGPLATALVDAIEGDSTLGAILAGDKIYNQMAPPGTPFPYCTLAFSVETADNEFGARGTSARQRIDIWGDKPLDNGNTQILAIWDGLYGLLHEQALVVEGFSYVIGTLDLIGTLVDPDGKHVHAIVDYLITSRQS